MLCRVLECLPFPGRLIFPCLGKLCCCLSLRLQMTLGCRHRFLNRTPTSLSHATPHASHPHQAPVTLARLSEHLQVTVLHQQQQQQQHWTDGASHCSSLTCEGYSLAQVAGPHQELSGILPHCCRIFPLPLSLCPRTCGVPVSSPRLRAFSVISMW